MKYFLDTEFIEYPCTIDLISIGIKCEDEMEFYAENMDCDFSKANDFVKQNVIPQLIMRQGIFHVEEDEKSGNVKMLGSIKQIAGMIKTFIFPHTPEFWGYYCVSPDTKILKSDLTWINADKLVLGDTLMGFDEKRFPGSGRSKKWRRWRNAIVTGNQRVKRNSYELLFDDGTKAICAEDHKWLVSSYDGTRWAETRYLKCDAKDGSASNIVKPIDIIEKETSFDTGYLCGAFDGEGYLYAEKKQTGYAFRLGFSQKRNGMLKNVIRILNDYNIKYGITKNNSGVDLITISKRDHIIKLLCLLRPYRLLPKFNPDLIGAMPVSRTVKLIKKEKIGIQPLIALNTNTKTYIANGLASHNCDYDWVAFCWLFGSMVDLPKGWPMYCRDLKQLADDLRKPKFEGPKGEHNALADARWNKEFYEYLIDPDR